ncbi:hypothetical protein [Streptomyces sp. NPDC046976]|uniref:hypothetical protein n=1 Tax=Streptomyces sp. NPDC046976 TaxID=3155258 RepID=UPI0033E553A4
MSVALAEAVMKPWWVMAGQYGHPRTVMHYAGHSCAVPREQWAAYAFNIAGGRTLRQSGVKAPATAWALTIWLVKYIEPATLTTRYALDYWSAAKWWVADHGTRAVVEALYDATARAQAECTGSSPAAFYDVTDVI